MSGSGTSSGRSTTGAPARGAAPPPLAADVGIVAALNLEVGFLLDRLSRVRKYVGPRLTVIEGEVDDKILAIVVGGTGRIAAREATELLLAGHRPRWVVSAGFAGALSPELRRNDVVMPNEIVDPNGKVLAVDVQISPAPVPSGPRLATGRLVTVDGLIATAQDKAKLRAATGADVVDMESSAVAAVCGDRQTHFLPIRVISDEAATDLPPEALSLMNRTGSRLVGTALRAIWKRPSCLKDLLALHNQAQEAADQLARVTLAALRRLPG